MAVISFRDAFEGNGENRLSPRQRRMFYARMKRLVVVVRAEGKSQTPRRVGQSEDRGTPSTGGGVIINNGGCILTSARLFPQDNMAITFRRMNHEVFSQCEIVQIRRDLGLAIIQPVTSGSTSVYCRLGREESIDIGTQVFSIAHPGNLLYSFVIGDISYECRTRGAQRACRNIGGVFSDEDDRDDNRKLQLANDLDNNLDVIQINNFHGGEGSFGSPIFDPRGRVIGVYSFIDKNYDYAVHVTHLRDFCGPHMVQPPPKGRKRKRTKKPHGSPAPAEGKNGQKSKRSLFPQWLGPVWFLQKRRERKRRK